MNKPFNKFEKKSKSSQSNDVRPTNINYMTPNGFNILQNELRQLFSEERPKMVDVVSWAASNGDRSENGDYIYGKKRLREIDKRIRYLTKRLTSAKVINPNQQHGLKQVFFGATVTYQNKEGNEVTIQLVGVDEADLAEGKINWMSPLARALFKSRVGDIIEFHTPSGVEEIKVLHIRYI